MPAVSDTQRQRNRFTGVFHSVTLAADATRETSTIMRVFRYARTADECPARPPDARSVDGAGRVKLRWRVADGWVDTLEHRWLLGYPDGDVVHLNGDPADNRPSNLEVRRR